PARDRGRRARLSLHAGHVARHRRGRRTARGPAHADLLDLSSGQALGMNDHGLARHTAGVLTSLAAVAVVTGAIFALEPFAPVLSLGVLYVFAVLPVAVLFGLAYALPVSVASMLAFNWFFLPPRHTFALRDSENWVALAVYLITASVASELAARGRRRAAEAEQREHEASLLADVAARLLSSGDVQSQLPHIAARAAAALR